MNTTKSPRLELKAGLAVGLRLAVLASVSMLSLVLVNELTSETIVASQAEFARRQLLAVAPANSFEFLEVSSGNYLANDQSGKLQGFVISGRTVDGYNGDITFWLGVDKSNAVSGVRVIDHNETPGLGDKIEVEVSNWIRGFDGKSLGRPHIDGWRLRRDGGEFDQFTGATITPRAMVYGVRDGLIVIRDNKDRWLAARQLE